MMTQTRMATAATAQGLLALGLLFGAATQTLADAVNPSFTPAVIGGLERLEFRSNGNNSSWSIGLGSNTQSPSGMVNTPFDWGDNTIYNFTYAINSGGAATFSLFDQSGGGLADLTWEGMTLGNTLQIHAKRGVDVTFAGESTSGDVYNAFGVDYDYVSIDPMAGFDLAGTIKFRSPIGNQSTSGVTITAGNIPSAVPIPAAAWLFGSALMGIAGVGYRRQSKQA